MRPTSSTSPPARLTCAASPPRSAATGTAPTTSCRPRSPSSTWPGHGCATTRRRDAYVRRIIVSTDVDERRRPWRRERPRLDGQDAAARPGLPVEERSELFEALQALPRMQRKTVLLRYWLGLSVQETARELGISEGTVKSHSSRGLASLQRVLAGI